MSSFLEKIFNSGRGVNKSVRKSAVGQSFMRINVSPKWIDTGDKTNCLNAYLACPPLYSAVNICLNSYMKGQIKHYKVQSNGKKIEIENSPLISKLKNPNPIQSGEEFLRQNYVFLKTTGNSQIFNVSNSFTQQSNYNNTKNLWNLPSNLIGYKLKSKLWYASDISDIVEYVTWNGQKIKFITVKDLILQNENTVDFNESHYLTGQSRIDSLNKPISTALAILQADNVLISNNGALGILTPDSANDFGIADSYKGEEKEELQAEFNSYGLTNDQFQVIIGTKPLKWQQMALPIKDLMLHDRYKDARRDIAGGYGVPIPLMDDFEGAAGQANMITFEKRLITNTIMSDWKQLESALNNYFELEQKNEVIEVSYDHIEALQKDRKLYAEVGNINNKTVLETQRSISEGITDVDSAVQMIAMNVTNGDEFQAKQLIGNVKVKENDSTTTE